MLGFLMGVAGVVAVSIFAPTYYAKFVALVRSIWVKAVEDNQEVK